MKAFTIISLLSIGCAQAADMPDPGEYPAPAGPFRSLESEQTTPHVPANVYSPFTSSSHSKPQTAAPVFKPAPAVPAFKPLDAAEAVTEARTATTSAPSLPAGVQFKPFEPVADAAAPEKPAVQAAEHTVKTPVFSPENVQFPPESVTVTPTENIAPAAVPVARPTMPQSYRPPAAVSTTMNLPPPDLPAQTPAMPPAMTQPYRPATARMQPQRRTPAAYARPPQAPAYTPNYHYPSPVGARPWPTRQPYPGYARPPAYPNQYRQQQPPRPMPSAGRQELFSPVYQPPAIKPQTDKSTLSAAPGSESTAVKTAIDKTPPAPEIH